ncbi:MAG: hypothetical protein IKI05_06535 [Bacteroidaceae bacterium]|nr:hypothetical protein [Bacteroidaceae bacterium]
MFPRKKNGGRVPTVLWWVDKSQRGFKEIMRCYAVQTEQEFDRLCRQGFRVGAQVWRSA